MHHLLRHRLGRHEHARDIDLEYGIGVLGGKFQRRGFLLDARGGNQAVEAAVLRGDIRDDLVQVVDGADVDAAVAEGRAELGFGAFLDEEEFFTRFFWWKC